MKNNSNIIKFHKQVQINISYIIFGIIIIYVLFHVFSYITSDTINIYEVKEGTISENTSYQALALREEVVINADNAGELFYYAPNLSYVGVKSNIFSIDATDSITEKLRSTGSDLEEIPKEDVAKLSNEVGEFVFDYNHNNFQKVYGFKFDLSSDLQQYVSENAVRELDAEMKEAQQKGKFVLYQPAQPGIVVYQTDGMEGLTSDNLTEAAFDKKNVTITNLKNQKSIRKGQSVYKLITSDKWQLVMEVDKKLVKEIKDKEMSYMQLRFLEDNVTAWAACETKKTDDGYYLILSMDDGVARYATSRFIPIELLLDEQSGLKIPNSAIVEKDFFEIPKSYFFKGNDSEQMGLMVKNAKGNAELVIPTIYYETEETYYVDAEKVFADSEIIKPNESGTYRVGSKIATLQGVYNVNKGYAVFKQIDILYQNEDYAIVNKGTSYGIASYDHIALQGESIKENDMIN